MALCGGVNLWPETGGIIRRAIELPVDGRPFRPMIGLFFDFPDLLQRLV